METDSSNAGLEGLLRQILTQLQDKPKGLEKLAAAYCAAWAELDVVVKNTANPHTKSDYADLAAVLRTIKPVFSRHGLALFQAPGRLNAEGDRVSLPGVLFHTSGQLMQVETEMPCRPPARKGEAAAAATASSVGSAITYGRRYQAQAVGGIAPVDDDGNEASGRGQPELPFFDRVALLASIAAMTEETIDDVKTQVQDSGDETLVGVFTTKRQEIKKTKKAK